MKLLQLCLLFLVASLAQVNCDIHYDLIDNVHNKCKQKFRLTPDDYTGKEPSRNAKCFLNCMMEDFPRLSEIGATAQMVVEVFNDTAPMEYVNMASDYNMACTSEVMSKKIKDKCEESYEVFSCLFKTVQKMLMELIFSI